MLYSSILETIGKTPLVKLSRLTNVLGLQVDLYAKVESFNPASSIKDRIAKAMIEEAEEKGLLNHDTLIIEPTSGNTGIGLAMVGAAKNYPVTLVMPETMSIERRKLMSAYGASIILTEGKKGMKGAIEKAEELHSQISNSIILSQFENPANPMIHYQTTGREIIEDCPTPIDIFVNGVGTGGSISGIGRFLKEINPTTKIVAVEPKESPILSGGSAGPHPLQGIGAGFIPKTLNRMIYDTVWQIGKEEAYEAARLLAKTEGILSGISSGAALSAALQIAALPDSFKKTIVVVLMDTGERYLSTDLY